MKIGISISATLLLGGRAVNGFRSLAHSSRYEAFREPRGYVPHTTEKQLFFGSLTIPVESISPYARPLKIYLTR